MREVQDSGIARIFRPNAARIRFAFRLISTPPFREGKMALGLPGQSFSELTSYDRGLM